MRFLLYCKQTISVLNEVSTFKLILLGVILLSVIMQSVIMPNVVVTPD
jgi:hypothetical protein